MSGLSASGDPICVRGPREEKLATVSPPGAEFSVAFSPGICVFSTVPSACDTISDGIVIGVTMVASSPIPGASPGALLTTIIPMAPAFWQLSALVLNEQVPRLTMQMLPAIAAALVSGQQASFGSAPHVPAGAVGSTASTTLAV